MDTPRPTGPGTMSGNAAGAPGVPGTPGVSKIQHTRSGLGAPIGSGAPTAPGVPASPAAMPANDPPVPMADSGGAPSVGIRKSITAFGLDKHHEDKWKRTPNATGHGAIHVKTFHCKLTEDALAYMDQTINEWLDAHPQYEVKFVTSTIGTFTGKLKEPAMMCQVWV